MWPLEDVDEFGLWTLIEDVTTDSGFEIASDCQANLKELVSAGNYRLRADLDSLVEDILHAGREDARATLRPLEFSELGKPLRRELALLELPVAKRAASEILQTEAQLNLLRFVGHMMSVARQENVNVLHEWSFKAVKKRLCPLFPFC